MAWQFEDESFLVTEFQMERLEALSSLTSHRVSVSPLENLRILVHLSFPGLWLTLAPNGTTLSTETDRQRALTTASECSKVLE
jgi:hypothetical protein